MANSCMTGITFYSKNKEMIEAMRNKFVEIYNAEVAEGEWSKGWMGDYVKAFYPDIDLESIDCKGRVDIDDGKMYFREGYYNFGIWTETAYTAKIGIWAHIVKDFYPEVKIAYLSEEYGWDYFTKWDETGLFYPDTTYVDVCYPTKDGSYDNIDDHYCWDIDSLTEWCKENLPFDIEPKDTFEELGDEIDEKLQEIDENYYCQAGEYMKIAPEDYDWRR